LGDYSLVTSVEENYKNQSLTKGFGLVSNYPNPFNPSTKIVFTLPQQDVVKVTVFDVLGRKVATLVNNQVMQSGQKTVEWNGTDDRGNQLSSGIYIYQIKSSQYQVNKKMMMLK
jgi:flagellar hook assembly protein FlgD